VEEAYCEMNREETPTMAGDLPTPTFDETAHALLMEA
jgi:hypothetical protein